MPWPRAGTFSCVFVPTFLQSSSSSHDYFPVPSSNMPRLYLFLGLLCCQSQWRKKCLGVEDHKKKETKDWNTLILANQVREKLLLTSDSLKHWQCLVVDVGNAGSNPAVFRTYCLLFAQRLLLAVLKRLYEVLWIKLESGACKVNAFIPLLFLWILSLPICFSLFFCVNWLLHFY